MVFKVKPRSSLRSGAIRHNHNGVVVASNALKVPNLGLRKTMKPFRKPKKSIKTLEHTIGPFLAVRPSKRSTVVPKVKEIQSIDKIMKTNYRGIKLKGVTPIFFSRIMNTVKVTANVPRKIVKIHIAHVQKHFISHQNIRTSINNSENPRNFIIMRNNSKQ